MGATDDQRWQATADRVELAELMHRYALAIDTAQFEDLREVFTADASVDFGSVDQYVEGATGVSGIDAIVGWFRCTWRWAASTTRRPCARRRAGASSD
jgi:hypothetical protein